MTNSPTWSLNIDTLSAVRDIFSAFVENCKLCYSKAQNVTIDEMLPRFRGKCGFRQYMPSKPSRHGIKSFSMVNSKVFYQEILKYMSLSSLKILT